MSASFGCKCGERQKPLKDRDWEVKQYKCNHSAFNGYKYTPSDYSTVVCHNSSCTGAGRTKAAFVDELVVVGKHHRATAKCSPPVFSYD